MAHMTYLVHSSNATHSPCWKVRISSRFPHRVALSVPLSLSEPRTKGAYDFFPPQQYNHVILVFSLQNCCVSPLMDPLQLVVIALTCHWLGGFAGNSSALSVTLWQTPAHAPRCPAPPANSSTGITVTQVYGSALKGPVMNTSFEVFNYCTLHYYTHYCTCS